ncbi:Rossmann-fold NAD(P)-binding domain-containing protein [Swaminathania salitolerans]|uniref:NAD(P)-dependent oxidoreductase n=1 Tax=Swaminathania salitolerans TaxID=182838 RepID=A0A511BU13_9PROT|nr:SDR family NAD(P)-dependent oxidoreductase [Swaminathania salitolerans]GBQ13269.1 nucleoside-diphosphate-sugar epimerase [Swaminathania salitolerans LMG 21291]GEL03263.1 NAD(P)-dependent oxidoreductase [Swaminathania salitolerans]
MPPHLVILGQGYSASATAFLARKRGWRVTGTSRTPPADDPALIAFSRVGPLLREATHLLVSIPPGEEGDPSLRLYAGLLRQTHALRWIGYYSTTGVYGDRQGARVDETTPVSPGQERSLARVRAESDWRDIAMSCDAHCDIMRLGGIYGPGRSAFDTLRSGKARIIDAPDHLFSRIHRDDIAAATLAAIDSASPLSAQSKEEHGEREHSREGVPEAGSDESGARILNFVDDTPSPQSAVLEEAARLAGLPLPPRLTLDRAWETLSPMARSFWSERRVVDSRLTQKRIGRVWRYPGYREGLAAIFAGHELG